MVMTPSNRALRLLSTVHHTREALGLERLWPRIGKRRTVYTWMRRLRPHLTYYPHIAHAGLGLAHVHLFIANAGDEWFSYPYAIERAWTIERPGRHTLYLHCLVPREHLNQVPAGPGITSITTRDGWQDLAPLEEALDTSGRPVPWTGTATPVPTIPFLRLAAEYPLLVPIVAELSTGPPGMQDIWLRIYDRLGEAVWTYLPSYTRRWRHNGKRYVRDGFAILNQYGLVLQHAIRYRPLSEHTLQLLLLTEKHQRVREAFAAVCPSTEAYPAPDAFLLRLHGDQAMLKQVITTPGIRKWWFVDQDRTARAPSVRFAYETLFDPATRTWTVPP